MSSLAVDVQEELDMPGGIGFIDATSVLERGTQGVWISPMRCEYES